MVAVSLKKQIVDIVVVRKSKDLLKSTTLPKIFWEVFEDFNKHNLISFKSYSESFNSHACEELYAHLTNYKKINKLKGHEVNLYVIAQHYPQKFLSHYEGSKFLKTIKKDDIFDLALGSLKNIRFIITRTTDNPLLALFSGDIGKVYHGYKLIKEQSKILNEVSGYLDKIKEFFGLEVKNMYTKEDFFRENPPSDKPFMFPWEKTYLEKELKRVRDEAEEKYKRLAEEKAKLLEYMEERGEIKGQIALCKEQFAQGTITADYYNAVLPQLEQKLKDLESKIY